MKTSSIRRLISALALALPCGVTLADPVSLDGALGAEWAGTSFVSVAHSATAPDSNFGTPTSQTQGPSYDIYMRSDSQYVYVGLQTTSADAANGLFANLYFSLRYGTGTYGNNGSSIGFELNNDRAFKPGGTCCYLDDGSAGSGLIQWAATAGGANGGAVIEAALDWSLFTQNALNVSGYGLPAGATALGLRLNLSQSFSYSVGGGEEYGDTRLGFVEMPQQSAVPEPATLALVGVALAGLGLSRRRRV